MSVTSTNYLNCSQDIVSGLIETVSAVLLNNFPVLEVDPYDIELVLDALRVLRPKMAELETVDAVLHMQRGNWDDAIQVFHRVIADAPRFAYAKALLAFCLSAKGDPNWRRSAGEAMEDNPDRNTRRLVRALEARDDLRAAVRTYRSGGKFEVPMSIATLSEESDQSDESTENDGEAARICAKPAAATAEAIPQHHYLRI
ncbi:HrpB1 family type III secretion system apparatus protein [Paraburkholderia fungorum]|uniref:HrpB1 family type III secretion system apparatus protein n=1 Tax=Paraburkholderia fungorum TaxID=134537 RepID=UPI0038B8F628